MTGTKGSDDRDGGVDTGFVEGSGDLGRSLLHALRNTGISVLYQDRDLRVLWAQNVPSTWATVELIHLTDEDFLPAAVARQVVAVKKLVLETAKPGRTEISIPVGDGARWYDLWMDADTGSNGKIRGLITTAVEITDQKRREQTLRALLREVSHRSKNLLAIIQSIATQTGRYSGTIDNFLVRFRGRLQSMASSQDLVTSSNWRGADLHDLVVGQVSRYSSDPGRSIHFEGERPWLNPNAALHVGLALHELVVNSVSYGALSRPDGFVTVSAELSDTTSGTLSLSLIWSERIDKITPDEEATREKRFGSVALERVVPASLNGAANLDIANGKLEYRLVIPYGQFELD
jgi:two-component sensor histidine kinase